MRAAFVNVAMRYSIDMPAQKLAGPMCTIYYRRIACTKYVKMGLFYRQVFALCGQNSKTTNPQVPGTTELHQHLQCWEIFRVSQSVLS